MSWTVLFTQVALPLALLAWLAFFPAAGWLAWTLQLVSVTAVLMGLWLAALWTMPPFWVPWVYLVLLLVIASSQLLWATSSSPGWWQATAGESAAIVLAGCLGLAGSYLAFQAIKGRALPDGDVVDIAAPFPAGHYLVAHGGSTQMVNIHLRTLDPTVERFRDWRGQSRALDIFRISPAGIHKRGWRPSDPARYLTYGTPVLAPCPGVVARVVDRHRDMTVPDMDREHMAGNHVAIDCGDFFVILAHLRPGSVTVAAGDRVETGEPLGEMGNSGNSSEPHLHVHAQRGLPEGAPLSGEPLWLTIDDEFPVRNQRIHVP